MPVLNEQTLLRCLEAFERGRTYEQVAKETLGASRRFLSRWCERSRSHGQAFYIIHRGEVGWFHDFIDRIRSEHIYQTIEGYDDCDDDELEALTGSRDRFLRDAAGNRIRRPVEAEPEMDDIIELENMARVPPTRPTPEGRVAIGRVNVSSDPPERLTGRPERKTTAELERSHPRAHQSVNADLRPAWARPRPTFIAIDEAGTGDQQLSEDFRMTMATQRLNFEERIHHGAMAVRDAKGNPLK